MPAARCLAVSHRSCGASLGLPRRWRAETLDGGAVDGNDSITVWVGSGSGDGGGSSHGGSGVTCTYVTKAGAPDQITWEYEGVTNYLNIRTCSDGTVTLVWIPLLSSRDLATMARDEITKRLPAPVVELAPAASQGIVHVGTWIWTDPAVWQPVTATASIPGLAATTTALPVRLRFDPGDGTYGTGPITCAGPGEPWRPDVGDDQTSSCMYRYDHASSLAASGRWTATMSIDWAVSFTASDGTGASLGTLTTRTRQPVTVGELEALTVRS